MLTQFGPSQYGSDISVAGTGGRPIACVGDGSDHGGSLSNTGGNSTVYAGGILVAINGATHNCPRIGHGNTAVSSIISKTYVNGQLVLTVGAVAGCGARITPPDRRVYCE